MPKLAGEPYDSARELFESHTAGGIRRCQAFAKNKLRALREEYGESGLTTELLANAQCQKSAQGWSTVCRHHGAGNKGGRPGGRPPSHGAYSNVLGATSIREKYEEALDDANLIELREELAITMALINDTLEKLSQGTPDVDELADTIECLGQALKSGDIIAAETEYTRLVDVFMSWRGSWRVLREVRGLMEQKRKLAGTELNRLQALQQMLTAQQAMVFLAGIRDTVERLFVDYGLPVEARQRLALEVRSLVDRTSSRAVLEEMKE